MPVLSEPLDRSGIEDLGTPLPTGSCLLVLFHYCAPTASAGTVASIRRIPSERVEETA